MSLARIRMNFAGADRGPPQGHRSPKARDFPPSPPTEVAAKARSRAIQITRHAILGVSEGREIGRPAPAFLDYEYRALPPVDPRRYARVAEHFFKVILGFIVGLHRPMARVREESLTPTAARHVGQKLR